LLQEAVEAARRLAGVWAALSDRSRPVAERLAGPLPGIEAWRALTEAVESAVGYPAQLLQAMAIDASALESATELVAFGRLARFDDALRVFEVGPPAVLVGPEDAHSLVVANADASGLRVAAQWSLRDGEVIALGDAAAYFATWGRDFLEAYIDARAGDRPA
jgi:hypothetical protein